SNSLSLTEGEGQGEGGAVGLPLLQEQRAMDDAVNKVLADYHTRAAREAELMKSTEPNRIAAIRDDLLLAVVRETGTVLNLLARGMGAKTIVELGTSYGYSTVYLAEAARATGGKVITFELAEKKARYAREQLARAGLEQLVEFQVGSALDHLATVPAPLAFVPAGCGRTCTSPVSTSSTGSSPRARW